jgi:predicted nucleic acid-binding protein
VTYLVDTSAWHRLGNPAVADRTQALMQDDTLTVCAQVKLEILFSARSAKDYDRTLINLSGLAEAVTGALEFSRALEVQQLLAHSGGLHHRSVTIADLIIAATAELSGLIVLHYDEDFDRISNVTRQPTEWLAPRGSL